MSEKVDFKTAPEYLVSHQAMKISVLFLAWSVFFPCVSAQAESAAYQSASPPARSIDHARVMVDDSMLPEGFSYRFKTELIYTPQYNAYVIGQHCYRGKPIRFDVPREKFTYYIDNEEYKGLGSSAWNRFHTDARLNFLLKWIDSAYAVVELNQSACADVVISTAYDLEEKLKKTKSTSIPLVIHDGAGKKIGEVTLK